jgi:alginate O-acetyltransferase complex protein AlgI
MIFLTYDFVWFALLALVAYTLVPWPQARLALLLASGLWFQAFYGGLASLLIVVVLATVAYAAGRTKNRTAIAIAIAVCVGTLLYYKYMLFLVNSLLVPFLSAHVAGAIGALAPVAVPLGISFFTFEFVHYLVDVYRGDRPVRSVRDFASFVLFWPTMIAGPIKRYQQFIPALHTGLASPSASDAMIGLIRVAMGFAKKWAADNLTGWIDFTEPHFSAQTMGWRWVFLIALAFRILLDFSGYSDMAIGFARMMGIVVPENFNWPYLARTPIEFWQRWHMSLSLWIRDYIYIPLGGNRLGVTRRVLNALGAMAICGLWHGPSWNFVIWGLYHGAGLTVATLVQRLSLPLRQSDAPMMMESRSIGAARLRSPARAMHAQILWAAAGLVSWVVTMIFVFIGWLLFFYPIEKAMTMAKYLFVQ